MADNWIFGFHAVTQVVKRGDPGTLYLRLGLVSPRSANLIELAEAANCPVVRWSEASFCRVLGDAAPHQGVAFLSQANTPVPRQSLSSVLSSVAESRTLLVLDGVTDPGNLGACLRSAATFGVDAVIVPKHGTAAFNATVLKRSAGAAAKVPIVEVVNLARALKQMKEAGFWVIGTALGADQALQDISLTGNLALVMGSEGDGLRFNTRKHCDLLAEIPMALPDFNLNVSVATGICLYEVLRQKHQAK